jgi:Type III flagellar switch regulator (C-ring) FliN C-term
MGTRPFRLCTAADLKAAQANASVAVDAWVGEWIGAAQREGLRISCEDLSRELPEIEANDDLWLHCSGTDGVAWASNQQVQAVARVLFGNSNPSDLSSASRIAQNALVSLLRRLVPGQEGAAPLLTANHPPPVHLREPGRLAMVLTITSLEAALNVLIENVPSIERRSANAFMPPLASAKDGIGRQIVSVNAWLGGAEIELGLLCGLAVGDVLRLDRRLTEGVDLKVGDDRLPCAAHLGVLDGQVTVEVSRSNQTI